LAQASEKPVINGLTDRSHPCQVLADLLTLEEVAGGLQDQHVVYIGDGNNIATSLIEASALTGFWLTVVSPDGYQPADAVIERARSVVFQQAGNRLYAQMALLAELFTR